MAKIQHFRKNCSIFPLKCFRAKLMALSCIAGLRHPFDIFEDYVNGETKIFCRNF